MEAKLAKKDQVIAEISEDLDIIVAHGFRLVRLYDSGENSQRWCR